ncbi:MAG: 16S rRNA (guanine(966)-N(2))-methyltransferase RsmD [Pseudomonadota bacterium]
MSRANRPGGGGGRVRIVAGEWRRRFIRVAGARDLRPTPDRVRETLFNWLAPTIAGARVLDAFAGSGILGLEALSRGAREALFFERNPRLVRMLDDNIDAFSATDRARVQTIDAWRALARPGTPHDLIFLDPPYRATAHAELCTLLQKNGWLAATSNIYLEQDVDRAPPQLPAPLGIRRHAKAGRVRYMLAGAIGTDEEETTWE